MHIETYVAKYGPAADFILSLKKRGITRLPWSKTHDNIVGRCTRPNTSKFKYYGGSGIKCLITVPQLMSLFYRDRAYLMAQPSIDRIDSSGHYSVENVRWIEFSANRKNRRKKFTKRNPLTIW